MKSKKLKMKNYKFFNLFLFALFILNFSILTIHSQNEPPKDVAPAPVKVFSEDEKKALKEETGIKGRTELSLRLMDARLYKAQELVDKPKFKEALNELGSYQLLLEDAFNFLKSNDIEKDKVLNTLKKFEIILRKHTTRLESIRREMPYKYSWHVVKLMIFLEDTRESALEPLYSDKVVKQNPKFI